MSRKQYSWTIALVAILFGIATLYGYFLFIKNNNLLRTHLALLTSQQLQQRLALQVTQIYYSRYINFDNIYHALQALDQQTQVLSKEHSFSFVEQLHTIYQQQQRMIERFERLIAQVNNASYQIQTLSSKLHLFDQKSIIDTEEKERIEHLAWQLLLLSYNIRYDPTFIDQQYRPILAQLDQQIIHHPKLRSLQTALRQQTQHLIDKGTLLRHQMAQLQKIHRTIDTFYQDQKTKFEQQWHQSNQMLYLAKGVIVVTFLILLWLLLRFFIREYHYLANEARLKALINRHIILAHINKKGLIVDASQAFCDHSGYHLKEILNLPYHTFLCNNPTTEQKRREIDRALANKTYWQGVIACKTKQNKTCWVDLIVEPLFDHQGSFLSFLFIAKNITNTIKLEQLTINQEKIIQEKVILLQKERDNALKLAQTKATFLANMSHEIRTPLNAILGFIDLLKEEDIGRKSLEYINIIDSSSRNLLQIIEDILDVSRIESGKIKIEKIAFNPKETCEHILALFRAKAEEKKIQLHASVDPRLPSAIITDPLRLKQIVINLLSNAIKFTPQGKSITLIVRYRDNLLQQCLQCSIIDEGIGIAKEKHTTIFEAFTQEDSSTTRRYGGSGLGLTISYHLAKLLGGTITLQSEAGRGSRFTVSLPVQVASSVSIQKITQPTYNFSGKRALIVEDNKANQMVIAITLQKVHLDYDLANNGLEAVAAYQTQPGAYDVILMDENMPEMSGTDATHAIRDFEAEHHLPKTPIIALTANAFESDRERFLQAGMDDYLAKPLNRQVLYTLLSRYLQKKGSR